MGYQVEMTTSEGRTLAVARFHAMTAELSSLGEKMGAAFGTVMAHLGRQHITPRGPAIASYERTEDGFDVAAGFPVDQPFDPGSDVDRLDLPAVEVAHTTHLGSYEDLPAAYDALRAEALERGRELDDAGSMWEEYWSGPDTPPQEARTEVFWPVRAGRPGLADAPQPSP